MVDELSEARFRSRVQVVIGGACTTLELAQEMGCNGHGADAVAAVRLCQQLVAG